MLYVIESDRAGHVLKLTPCDDGIDQALDIIAVGLSGPEDDPAVAYDVAAERWSDAVFQAEWYGVTAYEVFSVGRDRYGCSFGLGVAS